MPTVKRFEDLEVWQDAKRFTVEVYRSTDNQKFNRDRSLQDQLRRSAVSIMANIAEGFDRKTKKDFMKFLNYSLSSASEVKSHLYLSAELEYIEKNQANQLVNSASALAQRLTRFIQYLRSDSNRKRST